MGVLKGDFIGFTFDGIHSSDMGIIRVSDGSRYDDILLPSIQDKVTQVPGSDGAYYFGSTYTQRPISFPIAYDSLSENQLRSLRKRFGDKQIHSLIFDEFPYKVYKVKTTGSPNLKYVCFEQDRESDFREGDIDPGVRTKEELYGSAARVYGERVYRGEGILSFIAYSPYARSRFKYVDEYTMQNIPEWGSLRSASAADVYFNLYEWVDGSGLLRSDAQKRLGSTLYTIDTVTEEGFMSYNAGDVSTHFTLKLFFSGDFGGMTMGEVGANYIELDEFSLFEGDKGVQLNGALNLVEGIDNNGNPTGTIYNQFIIGGDFFKLEPMRELEWVSIDWAIDVPNDFRGELDYSYFYY